MKQQELEEYMKWCNENDKTMWIECISNGDDKFALSIGNYYILTEPMYIQEGNHKVLFRIFLENDSSEVCKYSIDLFKIPDKYYRECFKGKEKKCSECNELINHEYYNTINGQPVCEICDRSFYMNCVKCWNRCKQTDMENLNFIKDGSGGWFCKKCFTDMTTNGITIHKCKGCSKMVFAYEDREFCSKCRYPQNTIINKMFNKSFSDLAEREPCDEDEDGNPIYDEDERNLYHNSINPLSSRTNRTKGYRTIGVELEVIAKKELGLLKASQLLKQELHRKKFKTFKYDELVVLKEDGSLSSGGIEINSVIFDTSPEKFKVLAEIITIVNKYFTTDEKCGLHIHLDAQDLSEEEEKRIYYLYQKLEGVMYSFVHPRRLGNRYCLPLPKRTKEEFKNKSFYGLYTKDRYRAVNFTAIDKYGTIEIRVMEGTTNTEKILEWIKFHKALIDYAIKTDVFEKVNRKSEKLVRDILGRGLYLSYKNREKYNFFMNPNPNKILDSDRDESF